MFPPFFPLAGFDQRDCSSVTCHLYLYRVLVVKSAEPVRETSFVGVAQHFAAPWVNQADVSRVRSGGVRMSVDCDMLDIISPSVDIPPVVSIWLRHTSSNGRTSSCFNLDYMVRQ